MLPVSAILTFPDNFRDVLLDLLHGLGLRGTKIFILANAGGGASTYQLSCSRPHSLSFKKKFCLHPLSLYYFPIILSVAIAVDSNSFNPMNDMVIVYFSMSYIIFIFGSYTKSSPYINFYMSSSGRDHVGL